jgi:PAS domain S-box-containing protein
MKEQDKSDERQATAESAGIEQALKESEERFRSIFENAAVMVALVDKDGYVLEANEAAGRFLGYPRAELVGMHFSKFTHPEDLARDRELYNSLARGERPGYVLETRYVRKDGQIVWGRLNLSVVPDAQGGKVYSVAVCEDITERKRIREALAESEEKYRLVVEKAQEGIYVAQDGKIRFVNPAAAKFVECSQEELQGQPLEDFIHPDDRSMVLQRHYRRLAGEDFPSRYTLRIVTKTGKVKWAEQDAVMIQWERRPAALVFITDVSERKVAEEELKCKEQLMTQIIDFLPDATFVIDSEGRVVFWNRAIEELTGVKAEDMLGKGNLEYSLAFYSDRRPVLIDLATRRDLMTEQRYAYVRQEGDVLISETNPEALKFGSRHLWNTARALYDEEGNIIGAIESIRDITEKKQAEQVLLRTERLTAIADLAGGVAHNFNNLLQIVIGNLELALQDLESGNEESAREFLEQVLVTARSGAATVRNLQDFARVRAELGPSEATVLDLSQLLGQAIEVSKPLWRSLAEKEGIHITMNKHIEKGCLVKGVESELFEVLVNLIKNAVEAISREGAIRIDLVREDDHAVVRVHDTGRGIAQSDLGKVFEPFWGTKGVGIGTGMGLSVSHGIVQRHGGEISVESTLGKGTVFTVKLPLVREPGEGAATEQESPLAKDLSVLIVDDMPPITRLVEKTLTRCGLKAFSAASGEQALEIFKNQTIDVVICDLAMPGMNGWEVGKALRELCRERDIPKVPFILLTGWGGQALEQAKLAESGVDALVEKPISVKKLLQSVREVTATAAPTTS